MKNQSVFLLLFLFLFSCKSGIDSETYSSIQNSGNQITGSVQSVLLSNVGKSIQKGGPEYAVEFCNLKASSIVDSLNQTFDCTISRISEKNRNPKAGLKSKQEKELWEIFKNGELSDTVVQNNKTLVFYKPIKIGLPACLKCHGNPGSGINSTTHQKIKELYPNDLATGYSLQDFRGLWKIEFE